MYVAHHILMHIFSNALFLVQQFFFNPALNNINICDFADLSFNVDIMILNFVFSTLKGLGSK